MRADEKKAKTEIDRFVDPMHSIDTSDHYINTSIIEHSIWLCVFLLVIGSWANTNARRIRWAITTIEPEKKMWSIESNDTTNYIDETYRDHCQFRIQHWRWLNRTTLVFVIISSSRQFNGNNNEYGRKYKRKWNWSYEEMTPRKKKKPRKFVQNITYTLAALREC